MTYKTLWIGGSLSPYERLCISSFLNLGEKFEVFCYEEIDNLPEGCIVKDANKILNREKIFTYKKNPGKGSVAGFANWFRYVLLQKDGGIWVDTDVVLLKREKINKDFIISDQGNGIINNAILKIPPNHKLLNRCINVCSDLKDNVTWGQTGPHLLTSAVKQFKLEEYLTPTYKTYPIAWQNWNWVFRPETCEMVRKQTKYANYIHLWNQMIKNAQINKNLEPPKGSFIHELFRINKIF